MPDVRTLCSQFPQIFKPVTTATFALITVCLISGCGDPQGVRAVAQTNTSSSAADSGSQTVPPPAPGSTTTVAPPTSSPPAPPSPPASAVYTTEFAPLWEKAQPTKGKDWTQTAFQTVDQYGDALLPGTNDIKVFCPSYNVLTHNQKLNFWVYLVSAVAKYESGFDPASRYQESTLGTDSITGLPVWSEGLLQLSYQDVQPYPFCNQFDWNKDRLLSAKDPAKTILDPFKNLTCGIRILNQQVKKKDLIAFSGYWSTLSPSNANSAVQSIKVLTNSIPFCQ